MLKLFKSKHKENSNEKLWLYVPETPHHDSNSDWRRPNTYIINHPRVLNKQRVISSKIITFLTYIIILLCICLFFGIIKLLFFTKYETVFIDDGTYQSCIIDGNTVKPYQYK